MGGEYRGIVWGGLVREAEGLDGYKGGMQRTRVISRAIGLGVLVGGVLWGGAVVRAQAGGGGEDSFGVMERVYAPLCEEGEFGWGMKVRSVLAGGEGAGAEAKFSTGTRELFFRWATSACVDWRGDAGGYVQSHGDVHFGNVGSYVTDLKTGAVGVGLIDFDETVALPFEMDLLQAAVTLRLAGEKDGLKMDEKMARRGVRALLAGYVEAMESGESATELLREDGRVGRLLEVDGRKTPGDAAEEFVERAGEATFRTEVRNKKGELKDILRATLRERTAAGRFSRATLGAAIMRAAKTSPGLARAIAFQTPEEVAGAIGDAALRTHVTSGGSQGMLKVMVYVKGAIKVAGGRSDAVFYFKEEAASAAQRGGFVSGGVAGQSGGSRVVGGMGLMCRPEADGVGWCEMADGAVMRSFVVDVRTPWEGEVKVKVSDKDELEWAGRYLGICVGAAHTNAAGGVEGAKRIRERMGSKLEGALVERSEAFVKYNAAALAAFRGDSRVPELLRLADGAISRSETKRGGAR